VKHNPASGMTTGDLDTGSKYCLLGELESHQEIARIVRHDEYVALFRLGYLTDEERRYKYHH